MFLHASVEHIFFNMFALWMFGRTLEYELGSKRFLIYYMVCGVGAALIQLATAYLTGEMPIQLVGASGAVMGLLLAFGVMHPNAVIMLLIPPIPMKAKWFVVIYGVIELFLGWTGFGGNVAHFAHVGGMLWGCCCCNGGSVTERSGFRRCAATITAITASGLRPGGGVSSCGCSTGC